MEIPAVERFEEQVKYGRFHICNYVLEVQLGNEEMKNKAEMEKRADTAVISVLFLSGCANILAVYAQMC